MLIALYRQDNQHPFGSSTSGLDREMYLYPLCSPLLAPLLPFELPLAVPLASPSGTGHIVAIEDSVRTVFCTSLGRESKVDAECKASDL